MNSTSTWPFPHGSKWEKDLQKQLADYFKKKEYEVLSPSRDYILRDPSDWHNNIVLPRVSSYIEKQRNDRSKNNPFPLHKWIHHGLSSQALLFNLLGPLVVDEQWPIYDEILRQAGVRLLTRVTGAAFEVEDQRVFNERRGQPTSIDLQLHTEANENVFVEFKFTEKNFGGCSVFNNGDCDGRNPVKSLDLCYLHYIGCNYWELMKQHGLLTEQINNDSQCLFSTLYQLYRLILFSLEKHGHFLLLYDKRNPSFLAEAGGVKRGLFNRVHETLPASIKEKCHSLSIQSVVSILQKHTELDWVNEVVMKYF